MLDQIIHDQGLQIVLLLSIVCALADLAVGVIAALTSGAFTTQKVAIWITSHILPRVIPIVVLAAFSAVLAAALSSYPNAPTVLTAAVTGAWATVWAAIGTYVVETLGSLQESLQSAGKPAS